MSARFLVAAAACLSVAVACSTPPDIVQCKTANFDAQPGLPQVPTQGGPVLASPRLLAITFRNTGAEQRDHIHAFSRWVMGSDWLAEVGKDYGVGKGEALEHGDLDEDAPYSIHDDQIQDWLRDRIQGGQLPHPDGRRDIYMIFFPRSTAVHSRLGLACQDYGGYHSETHLPGPTGQVTALRFAYAVVLDCPGYDDVPSNIARTLRAASHELIEAATNPFFDTAPAYRMSYATAPRSPWDLVRYGELGDLCVGNWLEIDDPVSGYTFTPQRIWSNTAAAAGGDPCVPVAPGQPSFEVMAAPRSIQAVQPGQKVTLQITGNGPAGLPPQGLVLSVDAGHLPVKLNDPFNEHNLPLPRGGVVLPGAPVIAPGEQVEIELTLGTPPVPDGSYVTLSVNTFYGNQASSWPVVLCIP
jgi:hypothetical protein